MPNALRRRAAPRHPFWRRRPWVIGGLLCLAQCLPAQDQGEGVGFVDRRDDRFRREFEQLLLAPPQHKLHAGWALARELGQPVAPLLWEMLRAEKSNVHHRLVLLIAAVLAGGPNEDEALFAYLSQRAPMLEERTMAALLVALGPRRQRPMPDFWKRLLGPSKSPEQLLVIAARLASSRFPDAAAAAPDTSGEDPGLAGAAAFAGMPVPPAAALRYWQLRPERHGELYLRGELLGAAARGEAGEALLQRARALLADTSGQYADARAAALLLLARAGAIEQNGPPPDFADLQIVAGAVPDPRPLHGWLSATPAPRDDRPQGLAVAYALATPPDLVVDQRSSWAADPRIDEHVAVAFAFRLAGLADREPITAPLPNVPEWNFVRWATGAPVDRGAPVDDARLRQLLALFADGRASVAAGRATLEETLWRWGSHPGITRWRMEHRLVRDLLLSGSSPGGGKFQPEMRRDQRYFPTGLDRDDSFFVIAVALYDFLSRPLLPMPPEYRLR